MKKALFIIFSVFAVLTLMSCQSTAITFEEPTIDLQIDGEDVANITVIPSFEGTTGLFTNTGTIGYSVSIENKTDSIIKMVWEKSAVYYEGNSSLPFITGQKYIDSNSPMSPTVIPAHGTNKTGVYSADQVYYVSGKYGGWRMSNLPTFNTKLLLCIESSGGKETYYTFSIKGNPIYPPEEE